METYKELLKYNELLIEKVSKLEYTRPVMEKIERNIGRDRSMILTGLRQIGKTTLLKQVLKNHSKESLFVLINSRTNLEELESILNEAVFINKKSIILLDEIQELDGWGKWIIEIMGRYPATYILSGSASVDSVNTTGSARFHDIGITPLSYREYIDFHKLEYNKHHFNEYAGINAIFAYIGDNVKNTDDNIYERYMETYIYNDMRRYEKNIKTNRLDTIINFFKNNTSGEIPKEELINPQDGSRSQQYNVVLRHIVALKKYHVIKIVKRENLQGEPGKSYKVYLNPHLYLILNKTNFNDLPDSKRGYFLEAFLLFYGFVPSRYIRQPNNAKKYARQEVDFCSTSKWIEVKVSDSITNIKSSLNNMFVEYNRKDLTKEIISLSSTPAIKKIKNICLWDLLK